MGAGVEFKSRALACLVCSWLGFNSSNERDRDRDTERNSETVISGCDKATEHVWNRHTQTVREVGKVGGSLRECVWRGIWLYRNVLNATDPCGLKQLK